MSELPEPIREFSTALLATDDGESFTYAFDDATIDVPSRFDGEATAVRWRLDGTVTVRYRREREEERA